MEQNKKMKSSEYEYGNFKHNESKFVDYDYVEEKITELIKEKGRKIEDKTIINLYDLLSLKLKEDEMDYALECLYLQDITINTRNISLKLNEEYENINYINTYRNNNLKKPYNNEINFNKFNELLKEKDPVKKKQIRNDIIEHNMRLADFFAYKWAKQYKADLEELKQAAYEGLILAVDKYDPNKSSFSSYAYNYIKFTALKEVINQSGLSRDAFWEINRSKKGDIIDINSDLLDKELDKNISQDKDEKERNSIKESQKNFIKSLGPKYGKILAKLIVDEHNSFQIAQEKLRAYFYSINAYRKDKKEKSLDEMFNGYDEDDDEYGEESMLDYSSLEQIDTDTLNEKLNEVIDSGLTDREKYIIESRYGLNNTVEKTYEELSKELNVTIERIKLIERKALRKLRYPDRAKEYREYIGK